MSRSPLILPEVRWTWRRVFSFTLTAIMAGLLGLVIWLLGKLDDPRALMWLGLALCGVIVVVALLYMAGATTTDIARLTAAARGVAPDEGDGK